MEYDNCIRQIDDYINDTLSHSPIIVDAPNTKYLKGLFERYDTQNFTTRQAGEFVKKDTLQLANLKNALAEDSNVVFLFGLTLFLSLQCEMTLKRELKSFLSLRLKGKLIIVTYACRDVLRTFDKRLFDQQIIMLIDGDLDIYPTLNFYSPDLPIKGKIIKGIERLNDMMEYIDNKSEIFIMTEKQKDDFPNSMFPIVYFNTSYQVITKYWPGLENIKENAGTKENWDNLLKETNKYRTWNEYVDSKLPNTNNVSLGIQSFSKLSQTEQWAYYLTLRTYGVKGNDYLADVVAKSDTFEQFTTNCFQHILSYEASNKSFWRIYDERKKVIEQMQTYNEQISDFCKRTNVKGNEAFYYMTDLNKREKEQTIEWLSFYGKEYSCKDLISILSHTYPDLALYLSPYSSDNKKIDEYINLYKYCKVINTITDEMIAMMNHQAIEHEFISWLQPRTLIVDNLPKNKETTRLYFIDAMGVEYLSFLQEKSFEQNLKFEVKLSRCELPSITSKNKDFVKEFDEKGCNVINIKELDETKHGGNESYDYNKTKSPIHIVKELDILNELVSKLSELGPEETAYIISDHGATRLAVINENERKHEVAQKGLHSGRCCPKGDLNEKPEFAIEDNDFWCITNYDRFAGGRKASVEVHGGATIEEVAVPIITIRKQTSIDCSIQKNDVEISYNKNAQTVLYVSEKSDKISVTVEGMGNEHYDATKGKNSYFYNVNLPIIKKVGVYKLNVYVGSNLICKGLELRVKSAGMSEKKLF